MNNWNLVKLSTLCTRIGDGLHGSPSYIDYGKIYFINGNNLRTGKIVIDSDTKKVSEEELKNNFVQLNENSLLLGINGTLGNMAFYSGEKIMLGKSSAYLNFKSDINKFFYYYFQLPGVQKYFYDVATGSTIKNLSLKSLQDFEVPIPSNFEYKKIATVLSALDNKIELNNQINTELEAMAKTLYDYWFVQFDFPDENGKPYKSSGGKMVFNETLKREIPVGWEVKDFGEVFQISRGTLVTKDTSTTGDYKVVAAGLNYSYLHGEFNREKFTITVSGSGANAGFVNFWTERIFASDCTTVRGETDLDTFLGLQFLKRHQNYIYSQAKGSAQPHVYPSDIQCLKYLNSNSVLEHKAGTLFKSYYEKIANNLQQNQELAQLRDWLLPMLMNVQVRVGECDEEDLGLVAEERGEYKKYE